MSVRRSQKSQFDYHSYRGRTTVTDWLKRIALVLAVLVVILVAVLFFGQGSISYTDEGLRIHWPFSQQSEPQTPDPGNVAVIEGDPAALPDSSQEGETTPPEEPQADASSILSVSLPSLLDGSAAQLAQEAGADGVVITMKDENYIDESVAALEASLYAVFASDDYYTVTSMSEMLETMTSMINLLVGVLAGIAAISLVVGGIGIMNIMLVSVTERTREIGIRKSLGAKERYIMQQFVIEAAATSALGGIIGILLGDGLSILATQVVERLMEESLTISPTLAAVALAFGISVGIGIFFGYLPAKKAAQLNPIDALHYD